MWASQYWKFNHPYTWVNSGGLGTMGFSVPAAIGAKVGRPDRTVWAVDGDGCFQMTAQELVTASAERIPVKIAILNNAYLGMVRQWQEMFYDERYCEVYLSPDLPDYVKWAEAMGCVGIRVESPEEVEPAIEKANAIDDRPVVIEFRTDAARRCSRWSRPARATTTSSSTRPSKIAREPSDERAHRTHRTPPAIVHHGGAPHRPDAGRPSGRRATRCGDRLRRDVAIMSASATTSDLGITTSCRCSSRTRRACWPGWPACSPAAASTSSRWPWRRPRTTRFSRITIVVDVESAPLEQIIKQLFKLIDVVKITELDPRSSVERELLLVTVRATPEHPRPGHRAGPHLRGQDPRRRRRRADRQARGRTRASSTTSRSCCEPYGIVELQRTGRVALPKLDRQARLRAVKGKAG